MTISTTIHYVFRTKVTSIREEFIKTNWHTVKDGNGKASQECDTVSIGWFLSLQGSYESLHLGHEKPDLVVGQKIEIIVRPVKTVETNND